MFDWLFRPSCPCDSAAKAWVEERLEWLADEFDDSAFNGRQIVLPTPEYFPDAYDGTKKSVRTLLERVCHFMDADADRVSLKLVEMEPKIWLVNDAGHALPGAAGTFETSGMGCVIRLGKSELSDPMSLVGTMAHELAHFRLLGEGRILSEAFDNELLTDLTVVHFGLGIFLANSPRSWESQYTRWPDSDLIKPEYMTSPMFGWALAHLAWFRGETHPVWAKHLNLAARANVKQGLRYLIATGDSAYRPVRMR